MRLAAAAIFLCLLASAGDSPGAVTPGEPSTRESRAGDEILVCGQLFHSGTHVVLPTDPGGYNAAGTEGKPATRPAAESAYGSPTTQPGVVEIRGDNVMLPVLKTTVDQLVLHYDAAGLSSECFRVLHHRGLAIHFMCDIDGTIYQTLDLKEVAYHATIANTRSIGVEIAQIGAFTGNQSPVSMQAWYEYDPKLRWERLRIPARFGDGGVLTKDFIARPARADLVRGILQGSEFRQWDYTPQQYAALEKLAATLCTVFPKIQPDVPRQLASLGAPGLPAEVEDPSDPTLVISPEVKVVAWKAGNPTTRASALADLEQPGAMILHTLTTEQFANYQGILGHFHVQLNKPDPGPAFQWLTFISRVRAQMTPEAKEANRAARHQPTGLVAISRSVGSLPPTRPTSRPTTFP